MALLVLTISPMSAVNCSFWQMGELGTQNGDGPGGWQAWGRMEFEIKSLPVEPESLTPF